MRFGDFHYRPKDGRSDAGYVLLMIVFMLALVTISLMAFTAPSVKRDIQRQKEEEMIHRGAQYSRAVKKYFKKFGTYPTSLEQLEDTNHLRFLRKRYKDPMSKDGKWKLLHVGDVKLNNQPQVGLSVSQMNNPGQTSSFGQSSSGQSSFGQSSFGQSSFGQSSFGQSSFGQSSFGQSSFGQSSFGQGSNVTTGGTPNPTSGQAPAGGTTTPGSSTSSSSSPSAFGTPTFGAGAIIGVASTNEAEGLKTFNKKTHYNEWYFLYDPTIDRGGLISGPYTGKIFTGSPGIGGASLPGTPVNQMNQQSPFGQQQSPFGQSTFGQQPQNNQPQPQQPH